MATIVAGIKPFFGAARAFTEVLLGGPTIEVESNPTATNSVTVLLQANPDRVGLVFVNQGANDVFISLNAGVSTTNGIRLAASGGSITMDVRGDFTIPSRTWFAITTAGTSAMYILEVNRYGYTPPGEK